LDDYTSHNAERLDTAGVVTMLKAVPELVADVTPKPGTLAALATSTLARHEEGALA
jgi:hypothetical protein